MKMSLGHKILFTDFAWVDDRDAVHQLACQFRALDFIHLHLVEHRILAEHRHVYLLVQIWVQQIFN